MFSATPAVCFCLSDPGAAVKALQPLTTIQAAFPQAPPASLKLEVLLRHLWPAEGQGWEECYESFLGRNI